MTKAMGPTASNNATTRTTAPTASALIPISGVIRRKPSACGVLPSSGLLQESQVVLLEQTQVRDAVLEHLDPLRAHAGREPR